MEKSDHKSGEIPMPETNDQEEKVTEKPEKKFENEEPEEEIHREKISFGAMVAMFFVLLMLFGESAYLLVQNSHQNVSPITVPQAPPSLPEPPSVLNHESQSTSSEETPLFIPHLEAPTSSASTSATTTL